MKRLIIIFVATLVSACGNPVVHYYYKGVAITRVSDNSVSKFYYGDYTKEQTDTIPSYLNVDYFKLEMNLLMIFKDNKDVEVIGYDGAITQIGKTNPHFYVRSYSNGILDDVIHKYKKANLGIVNISDDIETEKRYNKKDSSKVEAVY